MTLVDSRPVSRRALERLVAEHDYELDLESLMAQYGLPLSQWLPAGCDHKLFRALQLEDIACAEPMHGAVEAVEAVRRYEERVVVVTAAPSAIAVGMLQAIGVTADAVRADVWAGGKVEPLREERCWAFVGDHADDMSAARRAGAVAIGVATGTSPPHGAQVELADLSAFASWRAEHSASNQADWKVVGS